MNIEQQLSEWLAIAFRSCGYLTDNARAVLSERPELGDYQCNGALTLSKAAKKSPRSIAEEIVESLIRQDLPLIYSIEGPGFINIQINDRYLIEQAAKILDDSRLGVPLVSDPHAITIDFGGPNVAKPLHVGHLRSAIIGDCLQRLHRFMGNTVTSDVHLGDWGTQMGMVLEGIKAEQPGLVYFNQEYTGQYPNHSPVTVEDLGRIYPQASARCKADPEAYQAALAATVSLQAGERGLRALWQQCVSVSVADIRKIYDMLGVHFDMWNGESTYNEMIPHLLEKLRKQGSVEVSEGALIIPLEGMPPLLLLKSDGAYLYATTDLAAIEERVQSGQQEILYVVDQRQSLHFKQLFKAAQQTGILPATVHASLLGFGTLNGSDGKPFKTRAGGVMPLMALYQLVLEQATTRIDALRKTSEIPKYELESIAAAVTVASLKFADLINNRLTDYSFDAKRITANEGKTGPYILYTAVRIKSLISQTSAVAFLPEVPLTTAERNTFLSLIQFPALVQRAAHMNEPHLLCEQAFALAQSFNGFYQTTPILKSESEELKKNRIALAAACGRQLQLLADLIGMTIPDRM